jgi:hypothetical protein
MGFFWNGEFKARTVKTSLKSRSQAILSTDYRSELARSGATMIRQMESGKLLQMSGCRIHFWCCERKWLIMFSVHRYRNPECLSVVICLKQQCYK